MAGVNKFAARAGKSLMEKSAAARGGTCIFVSHQFAGLNLAIRVGEELKSLELDIWLDADDVATQQAVNSADQEKLAQAIELGLCNCTHLLALISPNTKGSWWVPFEIGSARGRSKPLAFFVHKNVSSLPEYLTLGTKILDRYDFYKWAKQIASATALVEGRINLQKSACPNALLDLLPDYRTG